MKSHSWFGFVLGLACAATASGQTMIEDFEKYTTDDELLAAWAPSGNAIASVSDSVAPRSTGVKSMRVEFNFPQMVWATETVRGQDLEAVISIDPAQYL